MRYASGSRVPEEDLFTRRRGDFRDWPRSAHHRRAAPGHAIDSALREPETQHLRVSAWTTALSLQAAPLVHRIRSFWRRCYGTAGYRARNGQIADRRACQEKREPRRAGPAARRGSGSRRADWGTLRTRRR